MSNGRNWSSQKGPANTWNPTKNADGSPKDKATDKDVLDGYYIDIKEVPGQYEKPGVLITIEDEEGVKHGVWCGTVLQDLIKNVRLGVIIGANDNNIVRNNTIIDTTLNGIQVWMPTSGTKISNNTIEAKCSTGIYVGSLAVNTSLTANTISGCAVNVKDTGVGTTQSQ